MTELRLQPWERFMLLSHVLEEVPAEAAGEILAPLTACTMIVVRQLMGQRTAAEAFLAVEGLRRAIDDARRRAST